MTEPRTPPPHPRLERLIAALDRPLIGLAVAAVVLELIDLRGLQSETAARLVSVLTFFIDVVFVTDLVVKLVAFRAAYSESPWFLVDLFSSLPVLDTLASAVPPLRAVRFFRGFRMLRIFRGLRMMRALRRLPAFEQLTRAAGPPKGRHAMNFGMLALTVGMLATIIVVRKSMERDFRSQIDEAVAGDVSFGRIASLGGSFERPESPAVLVRKARVGGFERDVFFDLRSVDRRLDQFEFFLTLGMLFSMVMFMYLMAYHQIDVTQTQLRGLLNLALPRQVAEQFITDPSAYARKSRMPATVLFMDFVGFTRTCELLAHDPDALSFHLEAAMDRLVGELARHDMIIDKFIGDAVMSFRGGPLVGGGPDEHARRAVQAAIDSTAALAELNDRYFNRVKIGGASDRNCLIGAFGTSARLTYTILGDGVNLAARLEPASAQCATLNLFDEATFHLCAGFEEFAWRRWGRIRVAGKAEPIQVYEAFDRRKLADPTFIATFHLALEAFERHEFDRASAFFRLADSERPGGGDEPSRVYGRRCEHILLRGRPVGWEPVFETHK